MLALLDRVGVALPEEDLARTPFRVERALAEFTDGYRADPGAVLSVDFDGGDYDELIACTGIEFVSLCAHHLLPFEGTAAVGYVPDVIPERRVVGLSKLPRLVDVFAHRLQLQERLTTEIADAFEQAVHPVGVGVVIRARHACLACRGARKNGAAMITSAMRGRFRTVPELRAEFLALIARG